MTQHAKQEIDKFFAAIADWQHLYTESRIAFLAFKHEGKLLLNQARVQLVDKGHPQLHEEGVFETERLLAGHMLLSSAGLTPKAFVKAVSDARVTVAGREFDFACEPSGARSATFLEFDPDSVRSNKRVPKLILEGPMQGYPDRTSLDWHLKSRAFDSLEELCVAHGLGPFDLHRPRVEIMAASVAEIHTSSRLQGGSACLVISIAADAERRKAAIAYKAFEANGVERRGTISGTDMTWEHQGDIAHGIGNLRVPGAAAIQCFACFDERAQHSEWIGDPSNASNLRRLILSELDEDLEVLRDFLLEEKRQRKDARDLEMAVAWLLWMSGFAVLHPGTKRLEDNVDLVALTGSSNVLLVECTTGLTSREGKLSNLLHRVAALKKRLSAGGFDQAQVLGVAITTKPRDEVASDIREAAQSGVLVWTRDDLDSGLSRTLAPSDADKVFSEMQRDLARLRSNFPGG